MATSSKSILEIMDALNKRMEVFEKDLQQKTPQTCTTDTLAADFSAFKSFTLQLMRTFQQQLSALANDVDRLEMYSRRKILLVHGVPEQEKEDSVAVVTQCLSEHLNIAELNVNCISRSRRMGRATKDKTRPLIVKFRDLSLRNKVWFAKTSLKGTGFTVSEFLTKSRHAAFLEARQRLGTNKVWTRDGFIHLIGADGARHRISSMAELEKVVPVSQEPKQPQVLQAPKTRKAAAQASKK